LYAELGDYKVLPIGPPFAPEKYIDAIQHCISTGVEVVIIDSVSHEWEGIGGILDIHGRMTGNSFTNWAVVTPRHNAFVQSILQSHIHVICTIRSKQDYVIAEKNGKMVPEKVGLKGVTKDGLDYEFTLVFELNIKHYANATKDRTQLFESKPEFIPTIETGQAILKWCNEGEPSIEDRINCCASMDELVGLYRDSPSYQQSHAQYFSNRKQQLQNTPIEQQPAPITHSLTPSSNGISHSS
jgi:hypothetical protein